MGGVRVNVSLSITVTCAIAVSYLLPWVSVNYRGELVRRDRQKGGGRGGGVTKSSKYNSNKTVFKYPIQKYLRYGRYLRP